MKSKVFVVNMKRSVDRRKIVSKHLKSFGIDFEFFDAVDGKLLSQDYIDIVYDKAKSKNNWFDLNRAEIGCALSQIGIYKKMIDENIQSAIIFEDDIIINENFVPTVTELEKKVDPSIDLVLLGSFQAYYSKLNKKYQITENYEIQKMYSLCTGCYGYYITLNGAKICLQKNTPIQRDADGITGDSLFTGHKLYCIKPELVLLQDVESTIAGDDNERDLSNMLILNYYIRFIIKNLRLPMKILYPALKWIKNKIRN